MAGMGPGCFWIPYSAKQGYVHQRPKKAKTGLYYGQEVRFPIEWVFSSLPGSSLCCLLLKVSDFRKYGGPRTACSVLIGPCRYYEIAKLRGPWDIILSNDLMLQKKKLRPRWGKWLVQGHTEALSRIFEAVGIISQMTDSPIYSSVQLLSLSTGHCRGYSRIQR